MKNRFPMNKLSKAIGVASLTLTSVAQAAAPVFLENSSNSNSFEFLFNAQKGNVEHISTAVNSQDQIFVSYQNAIGQANLVKVAGFSDSSVSDLGAQSSTATLDTFSKIAVNPIDDSLYLAFVEGGQLVVKSSTDGSSWVQLATKAVTNISKALNIEVDSQGKLYILHTGNNDNTEILSLNGASLETVYGPVITKSNNAFSVAGDIAINSQDKPFFVFRSFAGATKNKTLLAYPDASGVWQTHTSSAIATPAYLTAEFDQNDDLHVFSLGYKAAAGGHVYKLDNSVTESPSWQVMGNAKFIFDLAEDYSGKELSSQAIDLIFDSNNVPVVAFQQSNNDNGKKHAQVATLVNDTWTEISYDLASNMKAGANINQSNHNYVDLALNQSGRILFTYRASGTGHNSYPYTMITSLVPANNTVEFTANELGVLTAKLTASDSDGDAITLSLTGNDASLFDIDQATGQISFKQQPVIAADTVYSFNVVASAGGEDTVSPVQVTLINDTSNDIPDSDGDGVNDQEDAFPNDPLETVDSDGDGVGDNGDRFPNDANESSDADGDGVGDNQDQFPQDPNETVDSDGDGVGDNGDFYPNDPSQWLSTDIDGDGLENVDDDDDDGDGVLDVDDAFPLDNTESSDTDGDGVGDNSDAFPNDANETRDRDSDGVGDNGDQFPDDPQESTDSDGDGVGDNGDRFPIDPTEYQDTDGDGFGDNMDPNPNDANDLTAPEFDAEPVVLTLDAESELTDIAGAVAELNIVANDMFDGTVDAVLELNDTQLESGRHEVSVRATDKAGNSATKSVTVNINPMVKLGAISKVVTSGTLSLPLQVSGLAPEYPINLDYQVTIGTTSATGNVQIDEGSESAVLTFAVPDSVLDSDEVSLQFTSANNASLFGLAKVSTVVDNQNYLPMVNIKVTQDGQSVSSIAPTLGNVEIIAEVTDANTLDLHQVSFVFADPLFTDLDDSDTSFTFDPELLETGSYSLTVQVSETNTSELFATEQSISLSVSGEAAELVVDTDSDGIPDEFDKIEAANKLPVSNDVEPLQVLPGLKLSLGQLSSGTNNASVEPETLPDDPHFEPVNEIINFNVSGLVSSGESVAVVLPLPESSLIPEGAMFRKYTVEKGWFDFVIDEANQIGSAIKDQFGQCPEPNSVAYLADAESSESNGLIAGNNCIQLLIEDGGENDADGKVNGLVEDPGVLVAELPNNLPVLTAPDAAALSGEQVELVASATDLEGDTVTFNWTQVSGESVTLQNVSDSRVQFAAPSVSETTVLEFEVVADDGRDQVTQTVTVTITVPFDEKPEVELDRRSGSTAPWLLFSGLGLIGLRRLAKSKVLKSKFSK